MSPQFRQSSSSAPRGRGGYSSSRGRSSSFSRPQYGRGRSNRGPSGPRIDVNRFINKTVVEEKQEIFEPKHRFIDFAIQDALKKNIVKKGYMTPTPIQDSAIPHVLMGSDVVGIANTGTGKTAAFLIPLINKVLLNKSERVLVMVPTRELAVQIGDELRGFAPGLGIFSAICVGGAGIGPQMSDLRRKPNFVIGT